MMPSRTGKVSRNSSSAQTKISIKRNRNKEQKLTLHWKGRFHVGARLDVTNYVGFDVLVWTYVGGQAAGRGERGRGVAGDGAVLVID